MSDSAEALRMLKELAANVRAGKCVDCRFFWPDQSFQRFDWFGLRKDVDTPDSIRYGVCSAHLTYAQTSREFRCKGKDWEPK